MIWWTNDNIKQIKSFYEQIFEAVNTKSDISSFITPVNNKMIVTGSDLVYISVSLLKHFSNSYPSLYAWVEWPALLFHRWKLFFLVCTHLTYWINSSKKCDKLLFFGPNTHFFCLPLKFALISEKNAFRFSAPSSWNQWQNHLKGT